MPHRHPTPDLLTPLTTARQLHAWLRFHLDISIPRSPVCAHHQAPFDYIRSAYFEPARDLVIWAPRGGGKTRLAAAATLLDLLHKPPVSVRILGGSLEQSLRMWDHLVPDIERLASAQLEKKRSTRRITLAGGSTAAVLPQSQRAVRGLRVQKLRCDEVELFDPAVWEAAQLVTRSLPASPSSDDTGKKPRKPVIGAIEAISTFHKTFGLMQRIIDDAGDRGIRLIRWCILDVLERCPQGRECTTCPLWDDCQGIAKSRCRGFFSIDDAIRMKLRVSRRTWESEMLCRRPSVEGCVFPDFDPQVHVREQPPGPDMDACEPELALAIDFGFAQAFVCLWVRSDRLGRTFVLDEHVQGQQTVPEHIIHIEKRPWGRPRMIACDPAGSARNEQTAMSNVALLRQAGFIVRYRRSLIVDGLEMIRTALRPAAGEPRLFIHPRCKRLIRAMQQYRYPPRGGENPEKDGTHDHLIDALRYYYVNRPTSNGSPGRRY